MSAQAYSRNQENSESFFSAIVEKNPESTRQFLNNIQAGGELTLEGALKIYQDGYEVRLTESMGDTYEALWSILGDEDFFELCQRYIQITPSLTCDLSDYGAGLDNFLLTDMSSNDFPFLPELARYCWHRKNLFHQADQLGLTAGDLALTPDSIVEFVPHLQLMEMKSAIHSIWKTALQSQGNPPADSTPALEDFLMPVSLMLWKTDQQVRAIELKPATGALLRRLMNKTCINEALSELSNEQDADPLEVERLFHLLAENRLILRVL